MRLLRKFLANHLTKKARRKRRALVVAIRDESLRIHAIERQARIQHILAISNFRDPSRRYTANRTLVVLPTHRPTFRNFHLQRKTA